MVPASLLSVAPGHRADQDAIGYSAARLYHLLCLKIRGRVLDEAQHPDLPSVILVKFSLEF
jgi:hypothetical protein